MEFADAESLLAYLAKTRVPTVLTEGSDDYKIMRKIEERMADVGVSFLPVGDKGKVLDVWKKLPAAARRNVVALVDLDTWILTGVPVEFQGDGLIYTFGYSIENDIFIDAELLDLCEAEEKLEFSKHVNIISNWYAVEMQKCISGQDFKIDIHANEVVNRGVSEEVLDEGARHLKKVIVKNYKQALRGKTLLQALSIQLNGRKRHPKFSYDQLYAIGSLARGAVLAGLESKIRVLLGV